VQARVSKDLEFELTGGPYAVTAARLALSDLDDAVDEGLAFDVRLLVSELVTNSVRHAELTADDIIDVHIDATPARLRVLVADPGPGFRWDDRARDEHSDGGFGMMLLGELASSWGVEPGAPTRVWFHIDRERWPGSNGSTPGLVGDRAG
jgi:anti-sigma regulatory factor (Ser/Thr protein kinase)